MREISTCSCLTVLAGPAWDLLRKTNKPLFTPLYIFQAWDNWEDVTHKSPESLLNGWMDNSYTSMIGFAETVRLGPSLRASRQLLRRFQQLLRNERSRGRKRENMARRTKMIFRAKKRLPLISHQGTGDDFEVCFGMKGFGGGERESCEVPNQNQEW